MHFVYLLLSSVDKKFYIGLSTDIDKRLSDHNHGRVKSTKERRPLELLYYEAYLDKRDAVQREKFLKSGSGHKFLRKQLKWVLLDRFVL
jgi:putative endonuclease